MAVDGSLTWLLDEFDTMSVTRSNSLRQGSPPTHPRLDSSSSAGGRTSQENGDPHWRHPSNQDRQDRYCQAATAGSARIFFFLSDCVKCLICCRLRDHRHRQDQHSGSDSHHNRHAVRPVQRDEGVQGRPQQQPRGQEPSRAHRDRPGSGPPPPPHRDREHRDREQVRPCFSFGLCVCGPSGLSTVAVIRKLILGLRGNYSFINLHFSMDGWMEKERERIADNCCVVRD